MAITRSTNANNTNEQQTANTSSNAVESVSVPLFTPITAPKITKTSHEALVAWKKQRTEYEKQIRSRCAATNEDVQGVMISIKNTFDEDLLEAACTYKWKIDKDEITDDQILQEIEKIISSVKNDTIPDIQGLFKRKLKIELSESDVAERILQYFKLCDKIIADYGLKNCFKGKTGAKEKCKLLIASLEPQALRSEVQREIQYVNEKAKSDPNELFDLIFTKALEQDRDFQKRKRKASLDLRNTGPNKKRHTPSTRKVEYSGTATEKPTTGQIAAKNGGTKPPPSNCPKCSALHWLSDCPQLSDEERNKIRQRFLQKRKEKEKKKTQMKRLYRVRECLDSKANTVIVNDTLAIPYCADTGSDWNTIPRARVHQLQELDPALQIHTLEPTVEINTVGGHTILAQEFVEVRLKLQTAAGTVTPVTPVQCLILDDHEDECILGNGLLQSLGIDVNNQLERLAASLQETEESPDDTGDDSIGLSGVKTDDCREAVESLIQKAIEQGFPTEKESQLRKIILKFDIWRTTIENDPPAKVPPLQIRLKPGATPYRCKGRNYAPEQARFLLEFNNKLVDMGWVFENRQSRWSCPALPVRKPNSNKFRQTIDYRPINAMTEPIAGTMPDLSTVTAKVKGSNHLASVDFIDGFWQLPLAPDSQEPLSYTANGRVYTPTRVPQGSTDAALHFQATMMECFKPMIGESLLVWIDDLLLYAPTIDEFLARLEQLCRLVDHYGLKLSAKKSNLYQRSIKWCGRIIDGEGVRHDPERLRALQDIPLPTTAGELQQFICAANWMRESMVDFARTVQPLQKRLDKELEGSKRTKKAAAGISIQLTPREETAFEDTKTLLATSAKLAHPEEESTICLFTDASNVGWAVVVTQVSQWDQNKTVTEQQHQLVTCLSGTFTGAQLNWSVIEKEAYPIVHACTKLDYLLLRPNGFDLYCDHRNIIYLFAPGTEFKKHVRGKLLRWSTKLLDYRYVIHHIEGPNNLWADMISRWAGDHSKTPSIRRFTRSQAKREQQNRQQPSLRPLDPENFTWPTMEEIQKVQHRNRGDAPSGTTSQGLHLVNGKIWIPSAAKELTQRLLVTAHCGPQGHRGITVMENHLQRLFHVPGLQQKVKSFSKSCLLCAHVKGPKIIQRPWSETYRSTTRNEALHWDFLHLGEGFGTSKYVLVLKDDATHFCELVPCDTPSSAVAVTAILAWHSRFGAPRLWISDQGAHFKNEVLSELSRRLKSRQTFSVAYSPWINGSVERVNRDLLQVLRVLILEYKLSHQDWLYLLPAVQLSLNHSPVASLAHYAPVELFTGLPAVSPLDQLQLPLRGEGATALTVQFEQPKIQQSLEHLRKSIQQMHQAVQEARDKRTQANKRRKTNARTPNFSVGDFVLRSRVDERRHNKLLVTWVGPYRITRADSHSFRVQHLITKEENDVHPSRLKFYADDKFQVTEEVLEHVAAQGIVLGIHEIKGHRWNETMKDHELLVAWKGLESIEDSWEPKKQLEKDVPVLIQQYVAKQGGILPAVSESPKNYSGMGI